MLGNNHLGNMFAEVITIKTLFASAKPSAIADSRSEFRGLHSLNIFTTHFTVAWYVRMVLPLTPNTCNFALYYEVNGNL